MVISLSSVETATPFRDSCRRPEEAVLAGVKASPEIVKELVGEKAVVTSNRATLLPLSYVTPPTAPAPPLTAGVTEAVGSNTASSPAGIETRTAVPKVMSGSPESATVIMGRVAALPSVKVRLLAEEITGGGLAWKRMLADWLVPGRLASWPSVPGDAVPLVVMVTATVSAVRSVIPTVARPLPSVST